MEGLAAAAVAFQLLIEGANDATNLVEFLINQGERHLFDTLCEGSFALEQLNLEAEGQIGCDERGRSCQCS